MATATITKIEEIQSQVIDAMSSIQAPVVDGVKTVVGAIDTRLPQIPEVPYATAIPTPTEIVKNQYDFAAKVLKTNKSLVTAVTQATTPLTDPALAAKKGKRAA